MGKKGARPTIQELWASKYIKEKKEPPWVFLEREMQEKAAAGIKPYNDKVGKWLKLLRDLKYHYFLQDQVILRRLEKQAGPEWFFQYSPEQIELLLNVMPICIKEDVLQNRPFTMRHTLRKLGVLIRFPDDMLMEAMIESNGDTALFVWYLFELYYKQPPLKRLKKYDSNSRILMSAFVFLEADECIQALHDLTSNKPPPQPKVEEEQEENKEKEEKKTETKNQIQREPVKIKFGSYLSTQQVTCYSNQRPIPQKKRTPLFYKVRLKNKDNLEKKAMDTIKETLVKRRIKCEKTKIRDRKCDYKFWEPPCTLRARNKADKEYLEKMHKFQKLKATPRYLQYKPPFDSLVGNLFGTAYFQGNPTYLLSNYCVLPTGYVIHSGGYRQNKTGERLHIQGHYMYPPLQPEPKCYDCDCMQKWQKSAMKHIKDTQCKCQDRYHQYRGDEKADNKYFYPPNKHGPLYFDQAKIYNLDPVEDYIKDCIEEALKSDYNAEEEDGDSVSAESLPIKDLLAVFLYDLLGNDLIVPHLPDANLLLNLQAWTYKRVRGDFGPTKTLRCLRTSERRWVELGNMDFRARAYNIPFKPEYCNYNQRYLIQKLFNKLYADFVRRNDLKQMQQCRLWWSTMKHDIYPNYSFLNAFFTYLPCRPGETFYFNPFDHNRVKYYATGVSCHVENPNEF